MILGLNFSDVMGRDRFLMTESKKVPLKETHRWWKAPSQTDQLKEIPKRFQNQKSLKTWQIGFELSTWEWFEKGHGLTSQTGEPAPSKEPILWRTVPLTHQAWFEYSVTHPDDPQGCSFYLGSVRFDLIDSHFGVYCLLNTNPEHFEIRSFPKVEKHL